MSYVLINGKRYYKDDLTGRTTLDNVSQAEADRRTQRNQGMVGRSPRARSHTRTETRRATANAIHTTGTAGTNIHTGFPWKAVIVCAVVSLFIWAFFYNRAHVSLEEQAITNHINEQMTKDVSDTAEAGSVSVADDQETGSNTVEITKLEEDAASAVYLIPDSAERYLKAAEVQNYNRDEIQLMINEIYARHGREFHTQENTNYFSRQDWYNPISGKSDEEIEREFNNFEKANVKLLCEYR